MNKIIDRKTLYQGKYRYDAVTVKQDNGEKDLTRECFERGNAVAALVWDKNEEKFVFTKQYRVGSDSDLVEIVAGTMDVPGELPEATMIRELEEELGYKFGKTDLIKKIGSAYPSPGACSEKVHVFYMEVSNKVSKGGGVEDESIETVMLSADDILAGNIAFQDLKTFFAIQWYFNEQLVKRIAELNEAKERAEDKLAEFEMLSKPGDTLIETLESINMTPAQLAVRMEREESEILEVISGKQTINLAFSLQLEKILGIDHSFWMNREKNYREKLNNLLTSTAL